MSQTTLLIVDDEIAFVDTMQKRLEKRNMLVYAAYDGEQAMTQLSTHPDIDLVILDMKMPGKDGLAVLQEIKQAHPLVEVIMLTGHATVPSAVEGIQFGAFDYLMKPCSFDNLSAKIAEAAELKRRNEAGASGAGAQGAAGLHG